MNYRIKNLILNFLSAYPTQVNCYDIATFPAK